MPATLVVSRSGTGLPSRLLQSRVASPVVPIALRAAAPFGRWSGVVPAAACYPSATLQITDLNKIIGSDTP